MKIIEFAILKYQCSILFVCHSADGKAPVRYRLFQQWNHIHKHPFQTIWNIYKIESTEQIYHVGVIVYNDIHYNHLTKEIKAPYILLLDKE